MTATFELPGINKQDVSIDVQNGRLTVSGESRFMFGARTTAAAQALKRVVQMQRTSRRL